MYLCVNGYVIGWFWILGMCFRVRKGEYIYREGFGEHLAKISPRSVKLAGSKRQARWLLPAAQSRQVFRSLSRELERPGLRTLSRCMKPPSFWRVWTLWNVGKESLKLTLKLGGHGGLACWRREKTSAWEAENGSIVTGGGLAVDLG